MKKSLKEKVLKKIGKTEIFFLILIISTIIMYFSIDREKSLISQLDNANQDKIEAYFLANNYEKYKKEFNIQDQECLSTIYNHAYLTPRELIMTSNNYNTEDQIDDFIEKHPNFYERLKFYNDLNIDFYNVMKKCIVDNENEKYTLDVIAKKLQEQKNYLIDDFQNNKKLECMNLLTKEKEIISKENGYDYLKDEMIHIFYNKDKRQIHYLRFCEPIK